VPETLTTNSHLTAPIRTEWIPLSQIRLHPRARPHNPDKLAELKESMRVYGQLQACRGRSIGRHPDPDHREGEGSIDSSVGRQHDRRPVAGCLETGRQTDNDLTPNDDMGIIELYIGQGRFLCAKELNWERIRVEISEIPDDEVDLAMLQENLKREDIDPITEAKDYKYLMDKNGWSQAEVAQKAGISQQLISRTLALLDLSPDVQDLTTRMVISKNHAFILGKITDNNAQSMLAHQAAKEDWSVKETENQVNKALGKPSYAKAPEGEPSEALAKEGKSAEGHQDVSKTEGGDPLSDLWFSLRCSTFLESVANWQVTYAGKKTWRFQVALTGNNLEGKPVPTKDALGQWFGFMNKVFGADLHLSMDWDAWDKKFQDLYARSSTDPQAAKELLEMTGLVEGEPEKQGQPEKN